MFILMWLDLDFLRNVLMGREKSLIVVFIVTYQLRI